MPNFVINQIKLIKHVIYPPAVARKDLKSFQYVVKGALQQFSQGAHKGFETLKQQRLKDSDFPKCPKSLQPY